ncbi:hypothetical protein NP493_3g00002 [Ridgeia piscesae]|uniref:Uncharacterized protein n=1 Tax=Ridgeia piscesae TaxID=27915 RepID=A0AAD9PG86_RIDPI|nr:hypothetical protein NP493_3g00002 [Ridgeia piscesae]
MPVLSPDHSTPLELASVASFPQIQVSHHTHHHTCQYFQLQQLLVELAQDSSSPGGPASEQTYYLDTQLLTCFFLRNQQIFSYKSSSQIHDSLAHVVPLAPQQAFPSVYRSTTALASRYTWCSKLDLSSYCISVANFTSTITHQGAVTLKILAHEVFLPQI